MNIIDYPKIYALGHKAVADIFKDEVVVEEKIDGSQFSFSSDHGNLSARSKGATINVSEPAKLFAPAVTTALELVKNNCIPAGATIRGEALCKPKHNTLEYARAPKGGMILFDVEFEGQNFLDRKVKEDIALTLDLEVVPALFQGKVTSLDQLMGFMELESCLGGTKIEGFVVKNYNRFGVDGKVLMAKFVSEAFKEKNGANWKGQNPNRVGLILSLVEKYKNENRWNKALQHLRDDGKLTATPSDIGLIMKEVAEDVLKEEGDEIKEVLFKHFWREIHKGITVGLPEWYKLQIAQALKFE